MQAKYRKTLSAIFASHPNSNMEWRKIESLFVALNCQVIEGSGSSVTFEKNGLRVFFHRPHPSKSALKYRIKAAKEFLIKIGETP